MIVKFLKILSDAVCFEMDDKMSLCIFRVQLPDPNETSCRKSTITIQGSIESAVTAKVYLLVSTKIAESLIGRPTLSVACLSPIFLSLVKSD